MVKTTITCQNAAVIVIIIVAGEWSGWSVMMEGVVAEIQWWQPRWGY